MTHPVNLISQRIERDLPFILSWPMPFIKSYFDLIKSKGKVGTATIGTALMSRTGAVAI